MVQAAYEDLEACAQSKAKNEEIERKKLEQQLLKALGRREKDKVATCSQLVSYFYHD